MVATHDRTDVHPRSLYRGVGWVARNHKWRAQIGVNGRPQYLGLFDREIDAALAYDEAAREVRGGKARLNFPTTGETPVGSVSRLHQLPILGLEQSEEDPTLHALPCYGREATWIVWQPGPGGFCELVTSETCPCGVDACSHRALVQSIEGKGGA